MEHLLDAKRNVFMLNNLDVIAVHLRGRIGTMQPAGAGAGGGSMTHGSRKEVCCTEGTCVVRIVVLSHVIYDETLK